MGKRIKTSSAKAKGRRLQKYVAEKIQQIFNLSPSDVKSAVGSENGMDVKLSEAARNIFPYAVECKSYKRIALYRWWDQAVKNSEDLTPILIIKENRRSPLVVLNLDDFLKMKENG